MPEVHTTGRTYLHVKFSRGWGDSIVFNVGDRCTTIDRPRAAGSVAVYLADAIDGDLVISSQSGTLCIDTVTVGKILPTGPG